MRLNIAASMILILTSKRLGDITKAYDTPTYRELGWKNTLYSHCKSIGKPEVFDFTHER